ncbi:MAG: hypothetical protein AAFY88_26310 [Acidobacteriota bacterium]
MSSSKPLAATSRTDRLVALDVLRGFALFGVLLVNLPFAALPTAEALQPPPGAGSSELWGWIVAKALAETKFVSLFSLLFGIGLVLQLGRVEARGGETGFYRRRLAILGAVGLSHGLLLWQGDILFPYAIAGAVLYLLRRRSPRTLVAIAAPLLVIGIALSTGLAAIDDGDGSSPEDAAVIGEIVAAFGVETEDPDELTWEAVERRAWTEGPVTLTLGARATQYLIWLGLSSIISFNWHVVALFCIGAAAMKLELLGAERLALHGRLAAGGVAAGLVLETVAVGLWLRADFAPGAVSALATLLHEVGSLALAAGYLGAKGRSAGRSSRARRKSIITRTFCGRYRRLG